MSAFLTSLNVSFRFQGSRHFLRGNDEFRCVHPRHSRRIIRASSSPLSGDEKSKLTTNTTTLTEISSSKTKNRVKLPWNREKAKNESLSYTYDDKSGTIRTNLTVLEDGSISTPSSTTITTSTTSSGSEKNMMQMKSLLSSLFDPILPSNFPDSVGTNYGYWVFWHVCRHTFRNAHYVLGTTTLLVSLGLSSNEALVISSALKWVLKDGVANITKFIISSKFAQSIDNSCKTFRFYGDLLMCFNSFVEIISIFNPKYFLLYGSLAALLKDAGDAFSGPSYRVFLDSFAINNNIGDVSAKGQAQVVLGNLIGLSLGVITTKILNLNPDNFGVGLFIWGCLSGLHLFSTYQAVRCVQLKTWNLQRLHILLMHFEQYHEILSIEKVNHMESIFSSESESKYNKDIVIGASLNQFEDATSILQKISDDNNKEGLKVYIDLLKNDKVGIIVDEDAQVDDVICGLLGARRYVRKSGDESLEECGSWARTETKLFMDETRKMGWTTNTLVGIGVNGIRYRVTRI